MARRQDARDDALRRDPSSWRHRLALSASAEFGCFVGERSGRPINGTLGGMDTKLHAVTENDGRPIPLFVTAGCASDYNGASALLIRLNSEE